MQKGVDGIITGVLHNPPETAAFKGYGAEFYGRSMHPAATVVRELVDLRNPHSPRW